METVVLIKTVGGEFYIGYHDSDKDTDDCIILNHTRNLSMQMTARGAGVAAIPVVPFAVKSPETIEFPRTNIICKVEEMQINPDMLTGYKSEITGIVTPKKPDLIIPGH